MLTDLKLSKKLALLISVPIVCQVGFVAVLWQLIQQSEEQAWKADHARAISSQATDVARSLVEGSQALFVYAHTRDKKISALLDRVRVDIPANLRTLRTLVGTDLATVDSVNSIAHLAADGLAIIQQSKEAIDSDDFVTLLALRDKAVDKLASTSVSLNELLAQLKESQTVLPEQAERARQSVKDWLGYGIAANIAITLLLGWYIQTILARRLNVVVDNTKRFAKAEKLAEPVAGKDEIAELDTAFHDMAVVIEDLQEQKKELAAMITHDLRTPLTSIQMTIEMCTEGVLGEIAPDALTRLNASETSCKQMLGLINDLLDLEKMEAGKLELEYDEVPVSFILDRSTEIVRGMAQSKNVKLVTNNCDLLVHADGDRMVQVLVNLLSNAIKFSPAGGTVTITTKREAWLAVVQVIDQGAGIPVEHHGNIFQKFGQVKQKGKSATGSSGLGLVFSKMIVEAHYGSIGFDSTPGSGTCFWFKIPLEDDA